jgi:hypothetical protein
VLLRWTRVSGRRALSVPREKISAARVYMKAANFSACLFVYKRSAFPFAAFSALSGKKSVQRPLNLSARRFQTKGRGLGFGSAL